MPTGVHEVTVGNKNPEMYGDINGYSNMKSGQKWSPSVIATTGTPVNPSRAPDIIRHPSPAIIIIVKPTSIVKGGQTPNVIRYPGVTKFSHYPTAICHVGVKISRYRWNPYRTILCMVNPTSIGSKDRKSVV